MRSHRLALLLLGPTVAAALALRPVSMAARALGPDVLLSPERRDSVLASWLAREEARRSRQ